MTCALFLIVQGWLADALQIGPYSPNTLARTPLPQELKVAQLELDDALYDTETTLYVRVESSEQSSA